MKNRITFIVILALFVILSTVKSFEIDSKGYVKYVVDGDTLDVYAISGFNAGETYRIRLADINAPEIDTPEGKLAKKALKSLVDGKLVYIDVDDITTYDPYGRVVAVIYLPVNETHTMNVNCYMVLKGYATIWNFTNNEFNPDTWKLYELIEETTPITTPTVTSTPIVKPIMSVSPENIEIDAYQGEYVTFDIIIKEITGLVKLECVNLHVPTLLDVVGPVPPNWKGGVPTEWISFDKNYFDVPAGEKVIVKCEIRVPKDAEPGIYEGQIVIFTGNDGSDTISLTLNVLEDSIPPEIEIHSPEEGQIIYAPQIRLKAYIHDNVEISAFSIKVNDVVVQVSKSLSKPDVSIDQVIQLEYGVNEILIGAEDSAGNIGIERIRVIVKDIDPPQIKIYSPENGQVVYEPYVTLETYITDNTEIQRIEIIVNGFTVYLEESYETKEHIVKELHLNPGKNYIMIVAEDSNGNRNSKTISVIYQIPVAEELKVVAIPYELFDGSEAIKLIFESPSKINKSELSFKVWSSVGTSTYISRNYTLFHYDVNGNGIIDSWSAEPVILYGDFGKPGCELEIDVSYRSEKITINTYIPTKPYNANLEVFYDRIAGCDIILVRNLGPDKIPVYYVGKSSYDLFIHLYDENGRPLLHYGVRPNYEQQWWLAEGYPDFGKVGDKILMILEGRRKWIDGFADEDKWIGEILLIKEIELKPASYVNLDVVHVDLDKILIFNRDLNIPIPYDRIFVKVVKNGKERSLDFYLNDKFWDKGEILTIRYTGEPGECIQLNLGLKICNQPTLLSTKVVIPKQPIYETTTPIPTETQSVTTITVVPTKTTLIKITSIPTKPTKTVPAITPILSPRFEISGFETILAIVGLIIAIALRKIKII